MLLSTKTHPAPRALVIEDDKLLQMIHQHCLTCMGFQTVIVGDAKSAMDLWSENWDLIFSDIGLPDMNGIELCRKRREFEKSLGIHTPSFAYSAFGPTIENECLDAGFDKFGNKPMSNEKLYIELQKLLPQFELTPLETFH